MKKHLSLLLALFVCLSLLLAASPVQAEEHDTLTVATAYDAITLDPVANNDSPSSHAMHQIYQGLIDLDKDSNPIPVLAESWELPDDVTYVFHLRKGVKFHNGEEMKAEDVAYSFERARKAPAVAHIFGDIKEGSFEMPDDYTIKFQLNKPNTGFFKCLAHASGFIVSKKAVEEEGEKKFGQNPVGTGPFKFVEWKKNDHMTFERFEDFWGDPKPAYKTMILRVIPEATNRTIELESGAVDIAYELTPQDIDRVESNPDLQVLRVPEYSTQYLGLNLSQKPLDDIRVRQAIAYGLDMKAIDAAVWRGVGKAATGPFEGSMQYSIANDMKPFPRDVEKAKELLKEAGYPDGLELTLSTNEKTERVDMAGWIKNMLAECGISVKIEVLEWAAYIEKLESGEQQMFQIGWTPDAPDADMALWPCFHSSAKGAGGNYVFLEDEKVDKLLEDGRKTPDGEERAKIYKEFQEYIDELKPWIYEHNGEVVIGAAKYIQNLEPSPYAWHPIWKVTFAD
ncbi:MAG: ABC transporter substrate-binding protein [Clostridiales bacterium]|nr:ABC transporter substrate-binding protein [Clostridiales bacterium]MDD7432707.1 ABC transporter substrate-binding protein [Clostridiales bacterium]MDY3061165.1 ABC transporter substrate-binding protein [Eubacteriales bacterium]